MKKDIKINERITTFFALEAMQLRKSKNQQHFLVLDLYDKTGKIKGYLWNDPIVAAAVLKEKSFVKVRGIATFVNDSMIINVEKIRLAGKEEVDIRDFLNVVSGGIEYWHKELTGLAGSIKDSNCRALIDSFLKDEGFLELFITSPGGIHIHHNYIGGLLEHTVSTMLWAGLMAERHPGLLDRDMLFTGAFLHDIGKTEEIFWEISREYTKEGKLLGHIQLGLELVEKKISGLNDFPKDLALALKHMIISHHGELEYGSPVRPATPEAIVLHLIENMDAKINHLYCHLKDSDPESQWSPYDKYLKTEIYQERFKKEILEIPERGYVKHMENKN